LLFSQIEKRYKFDEFHGATLRGSDFDAKPMVLLMGQYSVGKTTFIEWLLRRPAPGSRIGPKPTTDKFIAVMHGDNDQIIPGNAVSVDPEKPFHALNAFGTNFLNKFEASQCNSQILRNITLIDTPGILSGEKQRLGRNYDFTRIFEWFAARSDMILLLFDAHKLDISDEFREAIDLLKGNDEKVRVLLNKADSISTQQLMRVYGAQMWSLSKVIQTPEVPRVYIGSFWDAPYQNDEMARLFEAEQKSLLSDLLDLPRNSAVRKVNELVKRARLVRTHALILSHLRDKMPVLFGKDSAKADLIANLDREYREIERATKVPLGDFPDVNRMRELLREQDFTTFEKRSDRLFQQLDEVLTMDLPRLMKFVAPPKASVDTNPFAEDRWAITPDMKKVYDEIFITLNPTQGRLTGEAAREVLMNTGIGIPALRKIWELVDFEKQGKLDSDEFALALYLTEQVKKGKPLQDELPTPLVPPSKRKTKKVNPF